MWIKIVGRQHNHLLERKTEREKRQRRPVRLLQRHSFDCKTERVETETPLPSELRQVINGDNGFIVTLRWSDKHQLPLTNVRKTLEDRYWDRPFQTVLS